MAREQPNPNPVFNPISQDEFGRARLALIKAGITGQAIAATIGNQAGDHSKSEVARRIIAL